jgi:hypothetical protein
MQQGLKRCGIVAMVVLAGITSACGGGGEADDAVGAANGEADVAEGATGDGEATFQLHPSISDLPLPAGYEIPFAADAYTADLDPRETVVQVVVLTQPSDEVAAFLLVELPAAGFTLVDRAGLGGLMGESDIVPGVGGMVFFENPDGLPGQITINPQPDPPGGTSLNINFSRAGESS